MDSFENSKNNPDYLNPAWLRKRKYLEVEDLWHSIIIGDYVSLAKAITLIESDLPADRLKADLLISKCLQLGRSSERMGITGAPGVGKSTFIEHYGQLLHNKGKKIAVLAIDPTSPLSGGSILGDKTRMESLSRLDRIFIRPSASGNSVGGVARKTRESILLCEAAGFDTIFIETLGVGQSETIVHSMTDCFILLLQPGAGDELQGIKRGIVEMADLILVNKADGERLEMAIAAKQDYTAALRLFPAKNSGWQPVVEMCSALEHRGMEKLDATLAEYFNLIRESGYIGHHRREQVKQWFWDNVEHQLHVLFFANAKVVEKSRELEIAIESGQVSPFQAADLLLKIFLSSKD